MTEPKEARLWLVLGFSFIVGGGVPLALDIQNFTRTRMLDAEGLKIGVWCSFVMLAGLAAVVAWRIFRNMEHPPSDNGAIVWRLLTWGMPIGAFIVEWEWSRTLSIPVTLNQKAMLLGGGFIFMAGLLAVISQRVVHHMRDLARVHAETIGVRPRSERGDQARAS